MPVQSLSHPFPFYRLYYRLRCPPALARGSSIDLISNLSLTMASGGNFLNGESSYPDIGLLHALMATDEHVGPASSTNGHLESRAGAVSDWRDLNHISFPPQSEPFTLPASSFTTVSSQTPISESSNLYSNFWYQDQSGSVGQQLPQTSMKVSAA